MTATQSRAVADLAARRGPGQRGPMVEREAQAGETLRRIGSYLRPWRGRLVISAVLIVVSAVAALLAPWLQGLAIDRFVLEGDRDGLRSIVVLLAGLYAFV